MIECEGKLRDELPGSLKEPSGDEGNEVVNETKTRMDVTAAQRPIRVRQNLCSDKCL